ncbi:MAG: alpha/beta hydrolase [Chloroflexota bacterium]
MNSGYAPVENGELYYEVVGDGPAILLLHAGVADHTMWDPQMEAFSQAHTVVRYDLRGFGISRTQDTTFSNGQDIHDLLTHLGIDRATLIGNSRGGQIALDFTLAYPQMASTLVWVNGGVGGMKFDAPPELNTWFEKMEALEEAKDWEALTDLEVQTWADGVNQPEGRASEPVRRKLHDMILAGYKRADGNATPRPFQPPAATRLHEVQCPVLLVVGDLDTPATLASADLLTKGVPQAEKVVFHNVAHMASMEQPDRFNTVVLDFLARHVL